MRNGVPSLSTLKFNEGDLCLDSLKLDQFSRTYAGGYRFNNIIALSGSRDFKNKNFSNFYLTPQTDLSNLVKFNSLDIKPKSIYTSLNFSRTTTPDGTVIPTAGLKGTYLKFNNIIDKAPFKISDNWVNYECFAATALVDYSTSSDTLFQVDFLNDFHCTVSCIHNGSKYYLVPILPGQWGGDPEEGDPRVRQLCFAQENKIGHEGNKLEYVLTTSASDQFLSLFFTINREKFLVMPRGRVLIGELIWSGTNVHVINAVSAKLDFNAFTTISDPLDTSFVEYDDSEYLINNDKSAFNLDSNYLFHKSGNLSKNRFNILALKTISDNFDSFTSSNSLLSSDHDVVFARKLRNYTSILHDIDSEREAGLELNYVTYNINYKITPGTNFFVAPSSINPFTSLNINDTKFVESGAFAFPYPYFADRVYRELDDMPDNEAQYLCTWLSGAPGSAGLWVDRYYYPDYIEKAAALLGKPFMQVTYLDLIEKVINDNSEIKSSIKKRYFFDKRSDLTFEAKKNYKYERLTVAEVKEGLRVTFCDLPKAERETPAYFKEINENGGYALAFKFFDKDFVVASKFNELPAGINIEKAGDKLALNFTFFDNANNSFQYYNWEHTLSDGNENDLVVSFNNMLGKGTVYLNSVQIYSFNTPCFRYSNKNIIFGNIQVISAEFEGDIYKASLARLDTINDIMFSLKPVSQEDELVITFSRNLLRVDDLIISLPCGMRNFTDNINVLNTLATNLKSKSNVVDININNLNITDDNILEDIKDNLLASISKELPATSVINKLNFKNYL